MIDGYPTYTDFIMNNPDGLPISQAMGTYIRGNYNGPFVQDLHYLEQYYTLDEQKATSDIWGGTNAAKHILPPITPTSEESKEFAALMNEINTYRDEMTLKFILGTADIAEFDAYVKIWKPWESTVRWRFRTAPWNAITPAESGISKLAFLI